MRGIHGILLLLGVFTLPVFATSALIADETATDAVERKTVQQLLERIEQLERRIAALESQQARAPQPIVPQSPQYSPPLLPGPNVRPQPQPQPYSQPQPYTPTQPHRADRNRYVPQVPPEMRVPNTWQRFEFNGQAFYIVPIQAPTDSTRSDQDSNRLPRLRPTTADPAEESPPDAR